MMHKHLRRLTLAAWLVALAPWAAWATTTFPPSTGKALHNPHMGWILQDNAVSTYKDAGLSVQYVADGTVYSQVDYVSPLSDWGYVNPASGTYNWTDFDDSYNYWTGQGKKIILRFTTDAQVLGAYVGGCPSWVYTSGNGVASLYRTEFGTIQYRVPNYADSDYKTALTNFMGVFANRYSSNSQIEAIDLRAYGCWGEWHSGYDFSTFTARKNALKNLVDTWLGAYNTAGWNGWFLLSNSYEWRNEMSPAVSIYLSNPPTYANYLANSVFDYAFAKNNVSMCRDGLGNFVEKTYDGRHMLEMWRATRKPYRYEIAGNFDVFVDGESPGFDPQSALDETITYHPNWVILWGWDQYSGALDFYNYEGWWVQQGLKDMGYRLTGCAFDYPATIAPGQTLSITHTWQNLASGRLPKPYPVKFYLMNGTSVVWSNSDTLFDQTNMILGENFQWTSQFTLPSSGLSNGTYDLRVAMVDSAGNPAIALAMEEGDDSKRYKVGTLTIQSGAGQPTLPTIEGFEGGSFTGTNFYSPGSYGTITSTAGNVVSGSYSALITVPTNVTWADGIYSRTSLALTANASYRVTFRYKPLAKSGGTLDDPGFFLFFARTPTGGVSKDCGTSIWMDEPGAGNGAVTRTVYLTLGNYSDYRLQWGAKYGGTYALDNIRVEQIASSDVVDHEDFEAGNFASSSYVQGGDGSGAVSTSLPLLGSYSVKGGAVTYNTSTLSPHWTTYLQSDPNDIALEANTCYTVSFAFAQKAAAENGSYHYFLARTPTGGTSQDVGFTKWIELAGAPYSRKTFTFTTGNYNDYVLMWGLRNGGESRIDDILIVKNGSATPASVIQVDEQFADAGYDGFYDTSIWSKSPQSSISNIVQDGASDRLTISTPTGDWFNTQLCSHGRVNFSSRDEQKGTNYEVTIQSLSITAQGNVSRGGLAADLATHLWLPAAAGPDNDSHYSSSQAAMQLILYHASEQSGKTYVELNSKGPNQANSMGTLVGSRLVDITYPLTINWIVNESSYELRFNNERILGGQTGITTSDFYGLAGLKYIVQNQAAGKGSTVLDHLTASNVEGGVMTHVPGAFTDTFATATYDNAFDATRYFTSGSGTAVQQSSTDNMTFTPSASDWAAVVLHTQDTVKLATGQKASIACDAVSYNPTAGSMFVNLDLTGAQSDQPHYQTDNASLHLALSSNGGAYVNWSLLAKAAGSTNSNGTTLATGTISSLSFPCTFTLRADDDDYQFLCGTTVVSSGTHSAALGTHIGAYVGGSNYSTGRGSVTVDNVALSIHE